MAAAKRMAALFRLAGNVALGGGVIGVITTAYGAVEVIASAKGSAWMWIAIGCALLMFSFASVAYKALGEKEASEREQDGSPPRVKAAVFAEGREGGTGIQGPVRGEFHER